MRLVHITSEKSHQSSVDMINDLAHLLEVESLRFDKINPHESLIRYIDYLTEGLLPLFISYYERIISNILNVILDVRKPQGQDDDVEE